jgi:hypothetical protein
LARSGREDFEVIEACHLMPGVSAVSDLLFVVVTVAFFAVAALVVRGVERL